MFHSDLRSIYLQCHLRYLNVLEVPWLQVLVYLKSSPLCFKWFHHGLGMLVVGPLNSLGRVTGTHVASFQEETLGLELGMTS